MIYTLQIFRRTVMRSAKVCRSVEVVILEEQNRRTRSVVESIMEKVEKVQDECTEVGRRINNGVHKCFLYVGFCFCIRFLVEVLYEPVATYERKGFFGEVFAHNI